MTFILKHPTGKSETLIIMSYHFSGYRLKFSTGEHIHPDHWNPVKGRPRASAPSASTLHKYLDRLETKVRELHLELKSDFVHVTPDILRNAIVRDIKTDGKKESFVQFFERFIEEKHAQNPNRAMGAYNSVKKLVDKYPYSKEFYDINPAWFKKFQTYLENYRDKKMTDGYSANYIGKAVSIIIEVMSAAKKQKLHRNEEYLDDAYERPSEEVDSIYLTVDELLQIYNADLPEGMGRVRDRFIVQAFCGLRFKDNSTLSLDNIQSDMIYSTTSKTKERVVIPVHWVVKEIFKKYPDGMPPSISNQKTNDTLKLIGEMAKIKTMVVWNRTKGGKLLTDTVEKWNLISTHTARRSAITNMILSGVPTEAVKRISGHRSDKSFRKYLRMDAEQSARSISDHPFFNK